MDNENQTTWTDSAGDVHSIDVTEVSFRFKEKRQHGVTVQYSGDDIIMRFHCPDGEIQFKEEGSSAERFVRIVSK